MHRVVWKSINSRLLSGSVWMPPAAFALMQQNCLVPKAKTQNTLPHTQSHISHHAPRDLTKPRCIHSGVNCVNSACIIAGVGKLPVARHVPVRGWCRNSAIINPAQVRTCPSCWGRDADSVWWKVRNSGLCHCLWVGYKANPCFLNELLPTAGVWLTV